VRDWLRQALQNLIGRAARRPPAVAPVRALERRQLTVLYADLVGSTTLAAQLDPEDMSALIGAYHRCCTGEIARAGGIVAQFQGDGVIGYFGYDEAHEDDPERAIDTALALQERIAALPTAPGATLQARIGIGTGLVVAGDTLGEGKPRELGAVGSVLYLAARLQAEAEAGDIVIADGTKRLAAGAFRYADLGLRALKGFPQPLRAWRVLGPIRTDGRFEARRGSVLSPMVGRDPELTALLRKWQAAAGGRGGAVCITGEAGIGKSRLLREFRRRTDDGALLWLQGESARSGESTPFHAVGRMLRQRLDPDWQATPAKLAARLKAALRAASIERDAGAALVAEILDLPDEGFAPPPLTAADKRARLLTVLETWLFNTARRRPVVVAIEDLHWADPSTLELAERVIARAATAPILVVATARNGIAPPWPSATPIAPLPLQPLAEGDIRRIVTALAADGTALSDDLARGVVRRANGVPLFAEELARYMIEHNAAIDDREVPDTLADLLTARLDRLGTAKEIVQIAAVLGEEFPLPLLSAVAAVSTARLQAALGRLIKDDILRKLGTVDKPRYRFAHALIQDAAYASLLRSRCRDLHRRTVSVLSHQFAALVAAHPEMLARHWTGAGENEAAVEAWQRAGVAANRRRAFKEAEEAYRQSVAALYRLPETPTRDGQELSLQSALATILQSTRGYSAPATKAAVARARSLAAATGGLRQQIDGIIDAWAAASSGGDYAVAGRLADDMLELANAEGSDLSLGAAHMMQMTSRYRIGELADAEACFERGRRYFSTAEFTARSGVVAQTFGNAGLNAWVMGRAEAACERMNRCLAFAQTTQSPFDRAFALYMAAMLAVLMARKGEAEAYAVQSVGLSEQHGFDHFAAISRIVLGRARAEAGRTDEGIALIEQGLAGTDGTGSRATRPMYLTWLAEAQHRGGALGPALESIERALQTNPQELFFRPETLRLRSALRVRAGNVAQAEADLHAAIAMAQSLGARQLRDRATADLAALEISARIAPMPVG
jgi:class 3 adenylate cyclase/tetratricopeptide (TPR) repeat protein